MAGTLAPLVRLQDCYDALEEALDQADPARIAELRAEIRHRLSYQAQLDATAAALARNGITTHVREQFRALGYNVVRWPA